MEEIGLADVSCMFVAGVFSEWELDPSALVGNQSGIRAEQGMPWLAP